MPHVIDELILRLSLDPSQLTEGEQKLIESLRRMEVAATRGGKQVTDSVGRSTISFFRAIENPIGGLRRTFEAMVLSVEQPRQKLRELGEEGTKAGETVERGLSRGTVAVRALGVAGLAAFAAYETLSKTLGAVGGVAGRVFGAGLGAGAAGMNITQFGAISQALNVLGNVPQEQTQGWLANFSMMQRQSQLGKEPGVSYIQDLYSTLAQAAGVAGINDFGINPSVDTGEQVLAKLARGFAASPTEAMAQAAGNTLGFDLQQVHALRLAGQRPGGLEAAAAAQRALAPTPEQQHAAERLIRAQNDLANAWESLNRTIATKLDPALTTFVDWLNSFIQNPAGRGEDLNPDKEDPTTWWLHGGPFRRFFSGRSSDNTPASGQYADVINRAASQYGVPPQLLSNLMGAESNFDPNAGPSSADARGIAQFIPSTAQKYMVDVNDPNSSIYGAAHYLSDLYAKYGTWTGALGEYSNQGPSLSIYASEKGPYGQALVNQARSLDAGAVQQQQPAKTSMLPSAAATVQLASAQSGPVTTTHNYGDVVMNGDIVVNAPSREGAQIAGSVADQVRQLTPMTTPANTGLA